MIQHLIFIIYGYEEKYWTGLTVLVVTKSQFTVLKQKSSKAHLTFVFVSKLLFYSSVKGFNSFINSNKSQLNFLKHNFNQEKF